MLTLHNLKVYQKAVAFGAQAEAFSSDWGRGHAIVEHFRRAAESIVLNIAEAARLRRAPEKATTLDYAIGSSLECAACVDIARIKGRVTQEQSITEKRRLLEITRMLIGLRKSWIEDAISEEPSAYKSRSPEELEVLFHHESLDLYRVGLSFTRWFVGPARQHGSIRPAMSADRSSGDQYGIEHCRRQWAVFGLGSSAVS